MKAKLLEALTVYLAAWAAVAILAMLTGGIPRP